VGTFWYHSHQDSYRQVTRGLYGTLVVHPKAGPVPPVEDVTVAYHRLDGGPATLMGSDVDTWRDVVPGTPVRLRIVNSANSANVFSLHGVAARLVALDGGDLAGPEPVVNPAIDLTAGGRADLVFVMPAQPVRLDAGGPGLLLAPPGGRAQLVRGPTTLIDPFRYGSAAPTPFGPDSRFDRDFTLVLDEKLARHNGIPTFAYTVNGNAYPEIPTQLVRAGELVRFTIVARGFEAHPIHPHGHHVLVLSRNGVAPRTPLWLDTFEVRPGDVWQVAMRADNPGVWMDHCHDLRHAAEGMVFHLAYEGVSSPFALSPAG
jgi:FtsP/CotA-like multicopper oxidase with cupredoxin domain